jgi:GR25 family glycosyltransferase involved in LPS biosynthesis
MVSITYFYFYEMIGKEKVFACIASIPEREYTLMETIRSLINQVDKIYLYLNNYDEVTSLRIKNTFPAKIEYIIGDNSHGDAGKFYWANKLNGYILTGDDDIAYPNDYVQNIVDGIERYGRKAIISFHGRVLKFPMTSYRSDYKNYFAFNHLLEQDVFVHIAGTGCMGWHRDTATISMGDFPSANMADIYVSILAQKNKIPLVVLKHDNNWISGSYYPPNHSISGKTIKNDKRQTEVVNGVDWRLYEVRWVNENTKGEVSPSLAYVINLNHRADRYKDVFEECIRNGLAPIRIDAIYGEREFSHLPESRLLQAHYGCACSHIRALETAYGNGDEYSLVMEDDCVLADDFKDKLLRYSKQLPQEWDFLYLGGSLINSSVYWGGKLIDEGAVENFSDNLYVAKNVLTTHAYIVKNTSIPKLLDIIKSKKDRIDILFQEFQKGNNCFIVYPELAWQRAGYSDIVAKVTNNIHLRYSASVT